MDETSGCQCGSSARQADFVGLRFVTDGEQHDDDDDVVQQLINGPGPEEQPADYGSASSCRCIGTWMAGSFVHTCLSSAVQVINATSDRLLPL